MLQVCEIAGRPEEDEDASVLGQVLLDLDIGPSSVAGDRRLDPISAAVYLASPEITPTATAADVDVAMSSLRNARLDDWFEPGRRWLAGYWSAALDDPRVLEWCRAVLLASRSVTGRRTGGRARS